MQGTITKKTIRPADKTVELCRDIIAAKFPEVLGEPTIDVLDHGFITLVDAMPRLVPVDRTCDCEVVRAARVSTAGSLKDPVTDAELLRYLFRHKHFTPFEMIEMKFRMSMPIFVARQMVRHRTANINEVSGRYTELEDEYFLPEFWRMQSQTNKQGGSERTEYTPGVYASSDELEAPEESAEDVGFREYHDRLDAGVSKELARTCLPVSTYTQWIWKCDLRNILNFLSLRRDGHAQEEIRVYADAMFDLIEPLVPQVLEAWRDYHFEAVTLSRKEVEAMRANFDNVRRELERLSGEKYVFVAEPPVHTNKREQAEWLEKRRLLGLEEVS